MGCFKRVVGCEHTLLSLLCRDDVSHVITREKREKALDVFNSVSAIAFKHTVNVNVIRGKDEAFMTFSL